MDHGGDNMNAAHMHPANPEVLLVDPAPQPALILVHIPAAPIPAQPPFPIIIMEPALAAEAVPAPHEESPLMGSLLGLRGMR